jgi:hypothetical protein
MTLQIIDPALDNWVPDEDLVIETGTKDELLVLNPVQ